MNPVLIFWAEAFDFAGSLLGWLGRGGAFRHRDFSAAVVQLFPNTQAAHSAERCEAAAGLAQPDAGPEPQAPTVTVRDLLNAAGEDDDREL
jgi:hypothetical protein